MDNTVIMNDISKLRTYQINKSFYLGFSRVKHRMLIGDATKIELEFGNVDF